MTDPTPLSPATQAVLAAMYRSYDHEPTRRLLAAGVLRAAAEHINHDWSGFNCVDALCEIAAELDGGAQ